MFTPMLRTMSASASDERGEAWPTTCKATSQLYASASLPALRTRANPPVPTPPKPRLPTPSTSRPTLDLELPKIPKGMSQSKSLSALSLVANRRQEQLQGILNRSASLGQVLLEESAPAAPRFFICFMCPIYCMFVLFGMVFGWLWRLVGQISTSVDRFL